MKGPPNSTARTHAAAPRGTLLLLRALGAPSPSTLDAWLTEAPPTAGVADWLDRQGLAPLAFNYLAASGLVGRLDPAVAERLRRLAVLAAAAEVLRCGELSQVMDALAVAGVEFVLLKGSALAYSIYPDPSCRDRCDIDIWIDPSDYDPGARALAALGYARIETLGRPRGLALRFGGEAQMVGAKRGQGLVELHFRAFVGEWCRLATKIDHAAIWANRVPFPLAGVVISAAGGGPARGLHAHEGNRQSPRTSVTEAAATLGSMMAPEDQLLHLAVHFGVNHQFSTPNLRAVLDLHLLTTATDLNWQALVARARAWRVATVTWTALALSTRFFGTLVPDVAVAALRPGLLRRAAIRALRLDRSILRGSTFGYTLGRGLLWLLMTDRLASALRFVARTVVPEAEWLRARWDAEAGAPILPLLGKHWRLLLLERRS